MAAPMEDHPAEVDVLVARFLPSFLPAKIIMDDTVATVVSQSWSRALGGKTEAFSSIYTELVARGETYRAKPDVAFHSVFYGRLFELIPEVQSRFRAGGMQDQGNLFTRMFNFAVNTYSSDKEAFRRELRTLALFHNALGVIPFDYASMGQALLYALRRFLGAEFVPEVELAWLHFYGAMMEAIIPHVVHGGKLTPQETMSFVKLLKESWTDPSGNTAVPDLRTLDAVKAMTPSSGRMTTVGRGYAHHTEHTHSLSKLPRVDAPTTLTVTCRCGTAFKLAVPIKVATPSGTPSARNAEGGLPASASLPTLPPASIEQENKDAAPPAPAPAPPAAVRGRKHLVGLAPPPHAELDVKSGVGPSAPRANAQHGMQHLSAHVTVQCPFCMDNNSLDVPIVGV